MPFSGKQIITFAVFGVVALLILGTLGAGAGSYLYSLENQNADYCTGHASDSALCAGDNLTNNTMVMLMAGTILPIIWFVAVALKLL